ncbi:MAG: prolipoprotein diacylglyceryl transferase, partial [Clostridia bacterium]|nr:prolipoprotein diacylglyceryl transferase [Clostridia bacterium]MDY5553907.1 prolipoprotein diacylglyceryl transferase [Blautia sp.]
MEMSVRFPNLHLVLEYLPRSFCIFGMEFTLYGVLIAVGTLLGMGLVLLEVRRSGQDQNKYLCLILVSLIFAVFGSRLSYVVLSWKMYRSAPMEIFHMREGGYMFYGGLLAGILAVWVLCRFLHLSFWQIADTVCPGILLGQAVGRWGDFFNRESFGEYTDSLFAMQIPVSMVRSAEVSGTMRDNMMTIKGISYIQVHPVFLYESLWCFLLLFILLGLLRKKKFHGEIFMLYLSGYGLGRFFFEWLRTDKMLIPGTGIDISLVISAALVIIFVPAVIIQRIMTMKRAVLWKKRRERD